MYSARKREIRERAITKNGYIYILARYWTWLKTGGKISVWEFLLGDRAYLKSKSEIKPHCNNENIIIRGYFDNRFTIFDVTIVVSFEVCTEFEKAYICMHMDYTDQSKRIKANNYIRKIRKLINCLYITCVQTLLVLCLMK